MMEADTSVSEKLQSSCCIAGGGPAGMMLGFLLARAGINVLILEKHADFLRDFRGDTVHPSTLETMHELGLLEEFLKRPHRQVRQVRARIGGEKIVLGDNSYLRTKCRFFVMMPQWDFLDFLAEEGRRYPTFHVRMQAEVTGLIEENGRIRMTRSFLSSPITASYSQCWTGGTIGSGGFPILKGSADELRRKGIEDFRASIVEAAPFLRDRVAELSDWNDVKLLTVKVNRLRQWYRPGLLCIGDAAHAMSPIGGVGINLAIQDAVAAANVLAEPLRKRTVSAGDLAKIQRRRAFPTRVTQRLQELIRKQTGRDVGKSGTARPPWPVRLLERTTLLCRLRTRFVGVGIRPEHVKTPDVHR